MSLSIVEFEKTYKSMMCNSFEDKLDFDDDMHYVDIPINKLYTKLLNRYLPMKKYNQLFLLAIAGKRTRGEWKINRYDLIKEQLTKKLKKNYPLIFNDYNKIVKDTIEEPDGRYFRDNKYNFNVLYNIFRNELNKDNINENTKKTLLELCNDETIDNLIIGYDD